MTFSALQNIVGKSNVIINSSSFRFSELYALVQKNAQSHSTVLTIIVNECTLTTSEIQTLSELGSDTVRFDLTQS